LESFAPKKFNSIFLRSAIVYEGEGARVGEGVGVGEGLFVGVGLGDGDAEDEGVGVGTGDAQTGVAFLTIVQSLKVLQVFSYALIL
jgi:hypothetical protein